MISALHDLEPDIRDLQKWLSLRRSRSFGLSAN